MGRTHVVMSSAHVMQTFEMLLHCLIEISVMIDVIPFTLFIA